MTEEAEDKRIIIPREMITYEYEGETEYIIENCLAQLLLDDVCFLNTGNLAGRDNFGPTTYVFVGANDVFAWAYADVEPIEHDELPALYEMHMADPTWGAAKWAIQHRGEMPQEPVRRAMIKAGVWDLDESTLRSNTTDAETQALFRHAKWLSEQAKAIEAQAQKEK